MLGLHSLGHTCISLGVLLWALSTQVFAGGDPDLALLPNEPESVELDLNGEKVADNDEQSEILEADIVEYKLNYSSKIAGFNLETSRSLTKLNTGYRIEQHAKASLGRIDEFSEFTLSNGEIRSREYQYERSIMGAKRFHHLAFHPEKSEAIYTEKKGKKRQVVEIPEDVLDVMTYQLKMRLDLQRLGDKYPQTQYTTVKKKGLKHYDFEYAGHERITTKLGEFDAIKLSRIREPGDEKKTFMWLATEWDYVLIRLEHLEDGDSAQLDLASGTVNGRSITPLHTP